MTRHRAAGVVFFGSLLLGLSLLLVLALLPYVLVRGQTQEGDVDVEEAQMEEKPCGETGLLWFASI